MVFRGIDGEGGRLSARHAARRLLATLCSILCCTALLSCGGGMVAGVGSGGSGVAEGSITGFGSVLVDGVEYDDSALDASMLAGLRLGQRVRLTFDGSNQARSLELVLQLRGPVDQALDADGWMRVTGQWVRVVQSAADASRSGVTALGGFTSAGTIAAGQDVAVYGSWVRDESKAGYVLVASRIERVDTPADPVLTGGVVRALDGTTFTLNADSGGAQVAAPALPTLAVGQVVAVQAPRAALAGRTVAALSVQNTSLGAIDLAPYATVRVGGLATDYDPASLAVTVQGTRLQLAATPSAADAGALAARQFVRVEGASGASPAAGSAAEAAAGVAVGGTTLVGTALARPAPGATADATGGTNEVKGQIAGVDWSAPVVSFTLRNVPITATATAIGTACRTAPADTTLSVEVEGMAPAPGAAVTAARVGCVVVAPLPAASSVR